MRADPESHAVGACLGLTRARNETANFGASTMRTGSHHIQADAEEVFAQARKYLHTSRAPVHNRRAQS